MTRRGRAACQFCSRMLALDGPRHDVAGLPYWRLPVHEQPRGRNDPHVECEGSGARWEAVIR